MLFHTPAFLLAFLPLTLLAYYVLGRWSWRAALASLALASLIFYGWWDWRYVVLIVVSIAFNFMGSRGIARLLDSGHERRAKALFAALVASDLGLLAYFKYLVFFADQLGRVVGTSFDIGPIALPIGISFYTFTQIAYLADTLQRKVSERSLIAYVLFVSYFPHLVAGPVLHHSEMMPQFADPRNREFDARNVAWGLTFLAFGLFKKVVLADGCAPIANEAFSAPLERLSLNDAWLGALAYTLQIYYDFSGYSDMAIGLSLMFNVKLPINFFSPYRARSIIDFWRRWHMTLSRFLRDYLYIPLGGNRRGRARRYANLLVTMLLGGLWHGASWTFVAWGGLHGAFLVVNHLWRDTTRGATWLRTPAAQGVSWLVTLTAVVVAWVFFRAQSLPQAVGFVATMFAQGVNDDVTRVVTVERTAFVAALMVWALVAPNTCEVMGYAFGGERVAKESTVPTRWRLEPRYAVAIGALLCATAAVGLFERPRLEFLYYRF